MASSEWRQCQLVELAELFDGPHATPAKTQSGPVFLGISNIVKGRLDLTDTEHLSNEDYARWTRRVEPRAGDVVFSYETRLGEAARVPEGLRCCLGRRMGLLRARPGKVDQRFLLYAYLGPQFQDVLRSRTIPGSTVDRIPLIDMPKFPIVVPQALNEQRAIADVLGTLDDKIELNRKMSETLETMAQALFKSWFVDCDPVRAKAEGRDPGLPPGLAALFPAKLVDSELGEIPEGWEVGKLGDIVEIVKGRSYKSEELADSSTALVTLKSFARGGGYRSEGLKSFTGTYKREQVIEPGEVVVACTDVTQAADIIGRTAIVRRARGYTTLVASLDTMIARPRSKKITRVFLYHLGRTEAFVAHTYSHTTGTTVLHLAKEAVPSFVFAVPSSQLVERFDIVAATVVSRIDTLEAETEALAALRDTLLPKLISGELRVKDAERFLAERGL